MPTANKPSAFVLKYVLPDGITAGYHGDAECTLVPRQKARVYEGMTGEKVKKQVYGVIRNFRTVWNEPAYRNQEAWKGYSREQIKIIVEYLN